MSEEDQAFPSRLQKSTSQAPRGIGSGYAANQQLAGVKNPEEAAKAATKSKSEHMSTQDVLDEEQKDVDNMMEDISIAIREGVWELPSTVKKPPTTQDPNKLILFLSRVPPKEIAEWHALVQAAYDARINDEDEQTLRTKFDAELAMDPSDPLYNPMMDKQRRARIEAGLTEVDFEEMVFKGWTRQHVTVRSNFIITLRTIPTQHSLWLEWMMSRTVESSVQHTRHLFSLMSVAAGLDAINGKQIGPDITKLTKDDKASRESFEASINSRMEAIGRMPSMISDDLIIQQVWFNGRVRRTLAGDLMRKVGNS